MSNFRLVGIAALTAATAVFVANAAPAQTPAAANQSANPYLAGLPPPHEHHKAAHAKPAHAGTQHPAKAKTAQAQAKRRPPITANAKLRRPARLADKINSHVAWPSVEPVAADEPTTPPTALQFATDDAAQAPAAPPRPAPLARPAPPAPADAAKILPPAEVVATQERNTIEAPAEQPVTANTIAQTEQFEAPASNQMRVILPAHSEAPVTASIPNDQRPARGSPIAAQLLAMLAGAVAAGLVGWLMIGFGPVRTFK